MMSFGGSMLATTSGNPRWNGIADFGTMVGGAADLVSLRGSIVNMVQGAAKPLNTIGKIGAVLAVVTGPIVAITSGIGAINNFRQEGIGSRNGWADALDALSGATAAAGGICALTVAGAPAAPFLFAASGILSAASWTVRNWDKITNVVRTGVEAWKGIGNTARQIGQKLKARINEGVNDMVHGIRSFQQSLKDKALEARDKLKAAVNQTIQKVDTAIESGKQMAKKIAASVYNPIKKGITKVVQGVTSSIAKAFKSVGSALKRVFSHP